MKLRKIISFILGLGMIFLSLALGVTNSNISNTLLGNIVLVLGVILGAILLALSSPRKRL